MWSSVCVAYCMFKCRFSSVELIKLYCPSSFLPGSDLTSWLTCIYLFEGLPSQTNKCDGFKGQRPAGKHTNRRVNHVCCLCSHCFSLVNLLSHRTWATSVIRMNWFSLTHTCFQRCPVCVSVRLGNVDERLPGSSRVETPEEAGFPLPHFQAGRAEQQQQQLRAPGSSLPTVRGR